MITIGLIIIIGDYDGDNDIKYDYYHDDCDWIEPAMISFSFPTVLLIRNSGELAAIFIWNLSWISLSNTSNNSLPVVFGVWVADLVRWPAAAGKVRPQDKWEITIR